MKSSVEVDCLRYFVWLHEEEVSGWQVVWPEGFSESGEFGVGLGERFEGKRLEARMDMIYWHYDETEPMPAGWREASSEEVRQIELLRSQEESW